jgi:hypothetical protein
LAEVVESMSPIQLEFINKVNAELSKVESFFIERETEAREHSLQLRGQLEELKDHRHLYHVSSSFKSLFVSYRLQKFFNKGSSPGFSNCSFLYSILRVKDLDPDELYGPPLALVHSYG